MAIAVGDKLPEATLLRLGDDGPEPVTVSSLTAGRKIAIFGFPGAFTGTCATAHVPSFMRTRDGFADKGIDEVIGVTVPAVGFRDRSLRFAMLVDDGVVSVLNIEEQLGECTVSAGEALLDAA